MLRSGMRYRRGCEDSNRAHMGIGGDSVGHWEPFSHPTPAALTLVYSW